ncbi:MAG TPA: STAS domain-containing protein [Nocardioidaceae bacterium]|nr:STAS domain-containing protein [Nocardioidaceae bacterium]
MTELASVDAQDLQGFRWVRVHGEIDISNTDRVTEQISKAVPHDASLVVLDLSGTTYLDSSGISMLFRLAERLRYQRQTLRLVVPAKAPIRGVIELTRVSQVIPVQDDIQFSPGGQAQGAHDPTEGLTD